MAVCPSCGAEAPDTSRFCPECGTKLAPATVEEKPEATVYEASEAPVAEPEAAEKPTWEPIAADAPKPEATVTEMFGAPAKKPEFPAAPVYSAPAQPVYAAPTQPASVYAPPVDPDRPGKKSRYAPMTPWGMVLAWFLMSIPVVGLIPMILWSCGVCRKVTRRNLARAYLILLIIAVAALIVLALLARFVFAEDITRFVEFLLPGYTLKWN